MIKTVEIKSVATYGESSEKLTDLKKVNFIYGSNGTGKTTISRAIANAVDHAADPAYRDCRVTWQGGNTLKVSVYDRDFVDGQFAQPEGLSGVFTLGEEDKQSMEKIAGLQKEQYSIREHIAKFKNTLHGQDGAGGAVGNLETNDENFQEKCWKMQERYRNFRDAFSRSRGSKKQFMAKLLYEDENNSSASVRLNELNAKAATVFGDTPEKEEELKIPTWVDLVAHEKNQILQKNIIGKSDVDIAALIQRLGNSDWVKKGMEFYARTDRVCPFCQQNTDDHLEQMLEEYFDETFGEDVSAINALLNAYKDDVDHVRGCLIALSNQSSERHVAEGIQAKLDLFESKSQANIRKIQEKLLEPSKPVQLDTLRGVFDGAKQIIDAENSEIQQHNEVVANFAAEKSALIGQVWRFLLDEIHGDLAAYKKNKLDLKSAQNSLNEKIMQAEQDVKAKNREIQSLEKATTSIQPTIDAINDMLASFDFTGFKLAKADQDRFYKIERPGGFDAKKTLSEGEKSFLMFLYFYHSLNGSETETGMTANRVVVFDDPVSSLDSDILFIVSQLIKQVFADARGQSVTIKQVFVLTHNVYFHKQVSFDSQKHSDKTFWIVRKSGNQSKIQCHAENPIKTSYELLWGEVKNPDVNNPAIRNTLRRILEYYFKILGGVPLNSIPTHFKGNEKAICGSLLLWVHSGSHFVEDEIFAAVDQPMIARYLSVFQRIFEVTGHIRHYEMMMDGALTEAGDNSPDSGAE